MRIAQVAASLLLAGVLCIGCDASSRFRVLSRVFDGVPSPPPPVEVPPEFAGREAVKEQALRARRSGYGEHGPYAARMCGACHLSMASNTYVEPLDQLCFRCHDLVLDKKVIHGPIQSGGCTVCHDPHSSRYQYLLVSESDSFCFTCHQEQDVWPLKAHADIDGQPCTTCHDPHQSDRRGLLK